MTNGISGALGLVASLLVTRGDVVMVENPSYFLALSIFRDYGLRIIPTPLDAEGLDTDALERTLRADPSLRPRLLYTIPAFQNPTAVNLSPARKAHLCRLAAEFDFTILADEVYQLLSFDGAPRPSDPLCYFDTTELVAPHKAGHVISLGSFAKICAPGVRLGWMQTAPAGAPLLKRIFDCGQLDSSGGLNPIMSGIVHTFISSGAQDAHLTAVRAELTSRATLLVSALRKHLPPTATFTAPLGGYFVWITLPPGMRASTLLDACLTRHKCRFHCGERFGTGLENCIRLSFSYYGAADLEVGAQRLGEAMRELMADPSMMTFHMPPPLSASAPLALAVHGASGRLGSLILAAAADEARSVGGGAATAPPLMLLGAVPRGGPAPSGARVIVDVSLPQGTAALVASLLAASAAPGASHPPALVVGTTGDLPLDALRAYARLAPVVISANFSVGVPLMLRLIGATSSSSSTPLPAGWHGEVTEVHHTAKRDAPSGTAKLILTATAAAGIAPYGGAPGGALPVHSLRLGDAVGTHTLHLAGPGERLEITHTATRREVFALGALRTARWAVGQPAGLYHQ